MSTPATTRVTYYTRYERLWHWVQALATVGLMLTGFLIAFPPRSTPDAFRISVTVHNVAAWVLLLNAGLALFYNLASGLVRRYIPRSEDFFPLGVRHAKYYMIGIFRGDPHPFDRTPEKRLLPLQKITYFIILNLLLPLMVVTGLLMLEADHFPGLLDWFGGLAAIAPLHRFGAWLFTAFLILHVYMTTTGATMWTNLKTMITGVGHRECREEDQQS